MIVIRGGVFLSGVTGQEAWGVRLLFYVTASMTNDEFSFKMVLYKTVLKEDFYICGKRKLIFIDEAKNNDMTV